MGARIAQEPETWCNREQDEESLHEKAVKKTTLSNRQVLSTFRPPLTRKGGELFVDPHAGGRKC